jgi:hypothetical protein
MFAEKVEQRAVKKFCVDIGKKLKTATRMLCGIFAVLWV